MVIRFQEYARKKRYERGLDAVIQRGLDRSALPRRQRQIVERLARGWDYAEIADDLTITPHAVKSNMQHVYEKCGLSSPVAVVLWLLELGWEIGP